MRTACVIHERDLQYAKADWLSSRYPLAAIIVIGHSRDSLLPYLRKRIRRLGFWQVADEMALRFWWQVAHTRQDAAVSDRLLHDLQGQIPINYQRPPVFRVANVNSDAMAELLLREQIDCCVLMIHPIVKEKIFRVPSRGMLVFHPGIAPEYRGIYSCFWALHEGDAANIGWTLLRIDAGVDTGLILAQGKSPSCDPQRDTYPILSDKVQVDGLPHVARCLENMAHGHENAVDVAGRASRNYTAPGLTDYLRMCWRRRLHRQPRLTATSR
jgi:methionyl-tRNA formyltransferase